MVLHKDSAKAERWETLKQTNPILRSFVSLQRAYEESENPVISSVRGVTSTIASWFDENETAQVIRQLRLMDPTFDLESFTRELREYIVPELVDAYLSADREGLKMWCSEAVIHSRGSNRLFSDARRRHIMSFGLPWSNILNRA